MIILVVSLGWLAKLRALPLIILLSSMIIGIALYLWFGEFNTTIGRILNIGVLLSITALLSLRLITHYQEAK